MNTFALALASFLAASVAGDNVADFSEEDVEAEATEAIPHAQDESCKVVAQYAQSDGSAAELPQIEPDKAMTVLAVEYAVDECRVLVTQEAGIQPIPQPQENAPGLRLLQ